MGFLQNGATSVLGSTVSAAVSIFSGFTNFGIGFIFSIYILLQKETLAVQAKKLVRAFLRSGRRWWSSASPERRSGRFPAFWQGSAWRP